MRMEVIIPSRPAFSGGNVETFTLSEPARKGTTIMPQLTPEIQEDNNELVVRRSPFERILTSCNPILDSFLLQCPTSAILNLYHTSSFLRSFLEDYPLAWRNLSFKLIDANPPPTTSSITIAVENPQSKACDYLMQEIVVPFSLNLRSLDLDNTGVNGDTLTTQVLLQRRSTLEHLSVRGCRNVSLKYSILPHLELYARKPTGFKSRNPKFNEKFALKSLYVYRCRHHRRRPYLGSSADKTDSDSYATHRLVLECRRLGIWTDTGWCTTPAGRCQRRRSYANSRLGTGPPEVWVPFDRLWRSRNRIGTVEGDDSENFNEPCLWDKDEDGWNGEALGTGASKGEGRMVPVHERRTHRMFVDSIKCDSCDKDVPERCEQCSVLMHCAGCRTTLCNECAFDKPYHIDEPVPYLPSELWWAPGMTQSPNLLKAPEYGSASFPRIKMRWCCAEPMFSQGGGITFAVPAADNRKCDRIRAAPLAKGVGWEDDDFKSKTIVDMSHSLAEGSWTEYKQDRLIRNRLGDLSRKSSPCPRMFCESCYKSPAWKSTCNGCKKSLCNEHDLHGLRIRTCGYRDLSVEKSELKEKEPLERIPKLFSIVIKRDQEGNSKVVDFKLSQELLTETIRDMIEFYRDPQNMEAVKQAVRQAMQEKHEEALRKANAENQDAIEAGEEPHQIEDSASTDDDDPVCSISTLYTAQASSKTESLPALTEDMFTFRLPPPKWYGCHAMYCSQHRPQSDHRPRCTAAIKECSTCHVYVCPNCRKGNPPCKCSWCSSHYNCPNCYRNLDDGVCRKAAEEEAERLKKIKVEREKEERQRLNDAVGVVVEFFEGILSENEQAARNARDGAFKAEDKAGKAPDSVPNMPRDGQSSGIVEDKRPGPEVEDIQPSEEIHEGRPSGEVTNEQPFTPTPDGQPLVSMPAEELSIDTQGGQPSPETEDDQSSGSSPTEA